MKQYRINNKNDSKMSAIYINPIFDYDCDLYSNMLVCQLILSIREQAVKYCTEKFRKEANKNAYSLHRKIQT